MESSAVQLGLLFADISGSTALFERLGDTAALGVVSECIERLAAVTTRNKGRVIKTIGDEVMSAFPTADDAVCAGCQMQEAVCDHPVRGIDLHIRVGIHFGSVLVAEDGDLFGDAVNVAAHIVGIARADEIVATRATVRHLDPQWREAVREFDLSGVKGKADPMNLYEVIWRAEDVTYLAGQSAGGATQAGYQAKLRLRWGGRETTLDAGDAGLVAGRGKQARIRVDSPLASRAHLRLDYNRGKFILVDKSTNGTYVQTNTGERLFLKREQAPLTGSGVISLGSPVDSGEGELLYFEVFSASLPPDPGGGSRT